MCVGIDISLSWQMNVLTYLTRQLQPVSGRLAMIIDPDNFVGLYEVQISLLTPLSIPSLFLKGSIQFACYYR